MAQLLTGLLPLLLLQKPWQLIISKGAWPPWDLEAWEQVKAAGSCSQALSPLEGEWPESLGPQPSPTRWSDRTERALTPLPCAGRLLNVLHLLPLCPLCSQVVITHYPL